ncbi:MAG: peptide chain release factor N(5)-glutamine methyltransferase [Verrucomicrobiae bacterium]|nr:peptide chain release factor N(5)-glutamine methyltransferase [Verrucomicrobiae bacterium]
MKTVLETIQAGAGYLEKKGVENGRLNMQHLVAHVLGCDRMQLYVDFDRPLGEEELVPLRELLRRRSEGEPLQHLLGKVAFAGHDFITDSRALIPRPETEELVEKLIEEANAGEVPSRVLDMGTGSGVIGLSLGKAWKESLESLVLADLSPDALALARENAEALGLADWVALEWIESDLFGALSGRKFDLIVANLPYIAAAEVPTLSREVQRDPVMALDGGAIGTELMQRFIAEAPDYLNSGGRIAMEYGMGQAASLNQILEANGWQNIVVLRDLGKIERFIFASR